MPTDAHSITEAQRQLLAALDRQIQADLDAQEAAVAERERHARTMLEDCSSQMKRIIEARRRQEEASRFYRDFLTPVDPGEPLPMNLPVVATAATPAASVTESAQLKPKTRARIGDQRYRILHLLREHRETALAEFTIASRTGLTAKRVRDQIRADMLDGIIQEVMGDRYGITDEGVELMARFEAYKRNKGQPLPSLQGPISDDVDFPEPDEHETEEMAA